MDLTNWGTIISASGKAVSQEEMIAEKILRWCEEKEGRSAVGTREEKKEGRRGRRKGWGEGCRGQEKEREREEREKRKRKRIPPQGFKPLRISDMVST